MKVKELETIIHAFNDDEKMRKERDYAREAYSKLAEEFFNLQGKYIKLKKLILTLIRESEL